MLQRIVVFGLFLLLAACSSGSDSALLAKEMRWREMGLRDGERGIPSKTLTALQRLGDEKQAVNVSEYDAGYRDGLAKYCNVNNAYSLGVSGIQYQGVCSRYYNGQAFQMEWQRGYQAFLSTR
ncbi:MAG: DUF2799 domain-containing protein [Vibrionaceae bacterium]